MTLTLVLILISVVVCQEHKENLPLMALKRPFERGPRHPFPLKLTEDTPEVVPVNFLFLTGGSCGRYYEEKCDFLWWVKYFLWVFGPKTPP